MNICRGVGMTGTRTTAITMASTQFFLEAVDVPPDLHSLVLRCAPGSHWFIVQSRLLRNCDYNRWVTPWGAVLSSTCCSFSTDCWTRWSRTLPRRLLQYIMLSTNVYLCLCTLSNNFWKSLLNYNNFSKTILKVLKYFSNE